MTKPKGIVIAGNYRQYRDWCKENFYNTFDYLYISDPKDLKGFRSIPVHYVGQFWDSLSYGNPELTIIEYENARRQNMKTNWKEVVALIIALALVFGVGIFGVHKFVSLLEEMAITYIIR